MTSSQKSQGTSSPSASSIFLPLGRRSRRGSRASYTTQNERENLTDALNQIHTAASRSDTLTVFNEFSNPPVPSSTADDKNGVVGDLHGGLSGLYSLFRASVGGVKDIVGGSARPSEAPSPEETSKLSQPAPSQLSLSGVSSTDSPLSAPNSAIGSKVHSPVLGMFPLFQEGTTNASAAKNSKMSSKAGSVSSKTSLAPGTGSKSPLTPLSKVSTSATADPTVSEVNVSAMKPGSHHYRSNSGSLSASILTTQDPVSSERRDSPFYISPQSSQDLGDDTLARSPEWSAKMDSDTHSKPAYDRVEGDRSRSHDTEPYNGVKPAGNSSRDTRNGLSEIDTSVSRAQRKSPDNGSRSQFQTGPSTSSLPLDNSPAQSSVTNSISKLSTGQNSTHDGRTATTAATSVHMTDGDPSSAHSSKASMRDTNEKGLPRVSQSRLPGYGPPRMASSETTETRSSTAPSSDAQDARRGSQQPPRSGRDLSFAQKSAISPFKSKFLGKEYWMRDENAKDCFHCGESFSTFRRKHHCRTCGQIFDAKCTCLISGAPFGHSGSVRVCKPCEAVINAHEDDSSDFSGDDSSPAVINSRRLETLGNSLGSRPIADDDDTSSVVSLSAEQVLKTPTMAIPATRRTGDGNNRRSAILEIDSDRQLTRPTSSRSLRSSMNGRTHSVSHKRHHSRQQYIRGFKSYHEDRAPFQRRVAEDSPGDAKLHVFHRDSIIDPDLAQYLSDDGSSDEGQPNLFTVVSDSALSKSGGDNEKASFGGFLAAVKKGRSRFDRPGAYSGRDLDEGSASSSRAVNLPRSTRRRNLSVASSIHQRLPTRASKEHPPLVHQFHDHSLPSLSAPGNGGSSGFKMTRSSSMRGAGAPPVELNRASLHHVRKLLQQLLKDASVPRSSSWETALLPILLKATDDVEPNVQQGDDMDIRHYVKLKKIPGGRPGDTSYISGLVFTKNLALKSMPRSITRPNILIITFALEYARQQQHFMSLEPVIRQEREFLENLVGRISSLRPNVLLVEKNVSGLALGLLEKARIATAYNVKPSVIEAVSRCTQTRIITSMDKLVGAPEFPGRCGSFDVKTYVNQDRKKTYMYVSGCPKELGCTIVLRGANNDVLMKIKRITEFMVYVVYNLKLETCLMRDEFAKIPTFLQDEGISSNKDTGKSHTDGLPDSEQPVDKQTAKVGDSMGVEHDQNAEVAGVSDLQTDMPTAFYEDMVEKHQTKLLSASPYVKFEQPYLLMRARELERQLAYLKRLRDQDFSSPATGDEAAKSQKFVLITPEMIHESPSGASAKVKEVLHAVHDAEYDRALYNYQTQKRQWETYISGNQNLFDPYAHQNIVVLYSLVCTTTSIPCSGPDTFALDFYNDHESDRIFEADCTLGQYVEDLCHSANTVCSANGCEKRMFDHHQQYVHGEAQVSVFVQPYPSKLRGLQDTILMWSSCKQCGNETPAIPMSESTWKYSFGKYLELSFSSADLHTRAGVCPHDLHRHHLRYFGFKDVALRFHYDPIKLLEIIVPRPRVTWKVDKDLRLRNELYSKAEQRITRFMTSVKARLKGINIDSIVPEMAPACKKEIEVLIKRANDEHAALIKQHQDTYSNSQYWEAIPLDKIILATQEKVVDWDATFVEFERNYFPSEKDIKRLATLQLKRIFLDKDVSVTSFTSTDESSTTPTDQEETTPTSTEAPKTARRMTMSPQQAKSVLASVVEEHSGRANKEPQPPSLPAAQNAEATLDTETAMASQNQVQHLDLAIPSNLAERLSPPRLSQDVSLDPNVPSYRPTTPDAVPRRKSVSESETPVKNGVKEVIAGQQEDEQPFSEPVTPTSASRPSGIPRPSIEKTFRRSFKSKSPPLFRARSQPVHMLADKTPTQDQLSPIKPDQPGTDMRHDISPRQPLNDPKPHKGGEKRLSERLGLASLKSGKLSTGHSLIPRSVGKKPSSRVYSLARHFEQLSREFEKERQRERKQRAAQGKQSRAYPMASSNPIMEVYKSVKDAVEEREPSDEDFMTNMPSAASSKESTNMVDELSKHIQPIREEPKNEEQASLGSRPSEESTRDASAAASDGDGEDEQSDGEKSLLGDMQGEGSPDDETKLPAEDLALDLKELPKHDRSFLVKMVANFWAERSASGWAPLDYPLSDADHVFADCNIIVREDEPSSLIAFALESVDYKRKLRSIQVQDGSGIETPTDDDDIQDTQPEVEQSLLRKTGTHLKYQFQEGSAKMLCKVFFAEQFDALRRKCGVSERIVESLSRCMKWDSKGGKTKSLFLKTLDERFILKSLSTVETQAFLKFAPAYFQIMSEALFHELPSAIAKMFGFYQVIIKNPVTGVEFNWFLLLMENLFYDRNPTRIFDLKGSMRNRKVQSTGEQNEVLLDENMVEFIYESPLFTREHSKKLLSQSVWNDTLFLARQNVMDYSLMIAIDEGRNELVVGIIDCIRTYTWDKKLESWIKDRGFAGGGKNRPTVTSPKEYKSRFREAMARYVLQAPNSWHQFQIPDSDRRAFSLNNRRPDPVGGEMQGEANPNTDAP